MYVNNECPELFQDPVVALDLLYTDEILITVRLDLTFSLTLLGSPNLEEGLLAGRGWGQGLELCEPDSTELCT